MRLRLSIEAAPAYELVLSLAAPHNLPGRVDPALLAALDGLGHGSDVFWAHLLSVAVEAPPPRDVSAFLAHLATMDARDMRMRLAGYHVRWFRRLTPPDVIERALAGDARARAHLLATSDPEDHAWQAALRGVVETDAATLKRRLLEVVTRWASAVGPMLERRQSMVRREAARRRAQAGASGTADVIAAVVGFEYVPEPGIERVLLVPSAVVGSDRHVFDHQQLKLICYPVAVPAAEVWAPPQGLAAALQALGDPIRLRVLRMLAVEPLPAGRVAERLQVPPTTAAHHLALLRRAGVLSGGGRRGGCYTVDPSLVDRLAGGLREVVTSGPD